MNNWTKEPWKTDPEFSNEAIVSGDDKSMVADCCVANIDAELQQNCAANAARIAECVNFCEGVKIEDGASLKELIECSMILSGYYEMVTGTLGLDVGESVLIIKKLLSKFELVKE